MGAGCGMLLPYFVPSLTAVLIAGALYLVTAPLWLLFMLPGWLAWLCISVWFLYRIVRGWVNLNSNTPLPN